MGKYKRSNRIHCCLYCQNLKRHEARGLCKCCYNRIREGRAQGVTLNDFPLMGGYWGVSYLDQNALRDGKEAGRIRHFFDSRHITLKDAREDYEAVRRIRK